IATANERERTAYHLLSEHVRRVGPDRRLFIVHRLDRESSGVMVFAKSPEAKQGLQTSWREAVEKRSYSVVVEGVLSNPNGTIVSWLKEDKALVMRSSPVENGGKRAVTHYRVVSRGSGYTLLDVELETGRKNQIRAQLQSIGHSIVGDRKYGASGNPIGRLALHARLLSFRHPITGKSMSFESPIPQPFSRLVGLTGSPPAQSSRK
ncbi:MAG TPA: RNA pseudouridine synthase, partial [Spirochaetia bacterium]|nr:RNA pseudouridine synthase [Spirochaetia bacterium]